MYVYYYVWLDCWPTSETCTSNLMWIFVLMFGKCTKNKKKIVNTYTRYTIARDTQQIVYSAKIFYRTFSTYNLYNTQSTYLQVMGSLALWMWKTILYIVAMATTMTLVKQAAAPPAAEGKRWWLVYCPFANVSTSNISVGSLISLRYIVKWFFGE